MTQHSHRRTAPSGDSATPPSSGVTKSESDAHRRLKQLSLKWAAHKGYRIAAQEVTVHEFRFRLDAAAYKPMAWTGQKLRKIAGENRTVVGNTLIFECKQSRQDFLRDSSNEAATLKELERLHQRKQLYDQELRRHFPSLRNGDSLFPEFETYRLEEAEFEPYTKLVARIQLLSTRLHEKTKFDRLRRWGAANAHYLVAEAGVAKLHELPFGWGLLERRDGDLIGVASPAWAEVPEETRLMLLQQIAVKARRGQSPPI